jgi:hypothetical protein
MKFLGVLVLEERELELAEAWKAKDLVKGYGHLRSLLMELTNRSWPEIVEHIPRNLESGETPSIEQSPGCLAFMLSHIQFDWLRFGCVVVGSFFGSNNVVVRIDK